MRARIIGLFASAFFWTAIQPVWAAEGVKVKEKILHSFGNGTDGQSPVDGLVDGGGTLYGTTLAGGTNSGCVSGDCGTLFAVNQQTGAETVLHSFGSYPDGASPAANLIEEEQILYGTTQLGGANGYGAVFKFNPTTNAETVVYSFCSKDDCSDGSHPSAGLIDVKGTLYGTTIGDGGAVFALNPNTGAEKVLHYFGGSRDGYDPFAALVNVQGTLYGTTAGGGNYGYGTVFAINPKTGSETVVHSFCGPQDCDDGSQPFAGMINVDSTLYGTTGTGGAYSKGGTIFAYDPATSTETVVYSFCRRKNCIDGAGPIAGLINVKGTLYGTTQYGGAYNHGTVFAFILDTGAETVLHSFKDSGDGRSPAAGLISAGSDLYGTTESGGTYGFGTMFSVTRP